VSETISKLFSFVMLLVIMVMLFIWMAQQMADLATFFGFRTSHTVANDIANFMTSASGVPGDATLSYKIYPGSRSTEGDGESKDLKEGTERNEVKYDIYFHPGIVCVTSYFIDDSRSSTDCASHPFRDIEAPTGLTERACFSFTFEKRTEDFSAEGSEDKEKRSVMTVTEDGEGC
jgi:hypothetical protein